MISYGCARLKERKILNKNKKKILYPIKELNHIICYKTIKKKLLFQLVFLISKFNTNAKIVLYKEIYH